MAHWRDTYKPARFFIFDARGGVMVLLTLLHFRIWTVALTTTVLVILYWLEKNGLSISSAFRALRAWVIGDERPARMRKKIRGPVDYDRVQSTDET